MNALESWMVREEVKLSIRIGFSMVEIDVYVYAHVYMYVFYMDVYRCVHVYTI